MRSLRLTAVLSVATWLCLSGTTSRGVDAPPPPETGTNQHNPFAGMDGRITTLLDGYKNLRPGAQQGIAVTLRTVLENFYSSHRFATVVYDYNKVNAYEASTLLLPGDSSGAITGPAGCDQAGVDPPWDTCWKGGSLMRLFAGSRAVDAQGQPTFIRTAVVFWWSITEAIQEQVPGSPAQATQALKSAWWYHLGDSQEHLWKSCTRKKIIPVDVTVMASCFTEAAEKQMARPRGFLVAPAQATYDFSSGHIFMLDAEIRPVVPEGKYGRRLQIKLLLAALL